MRHLTPISVAFILFTAGCAGFLPWTHSNSNHSPTTTAGPSSYPPGANGQWIFDAKQLIAAHESVLDGSNYRMHVDVRSNQSDGSMTWQNRTLTVRVGGSHALLKGRGGTLGKQNLTGYSSEDMMAYCREDATVCHYRDVSGRFRQIPNEEASQIQSVLAGSDFVANGTTTRGGTTLYRYETDGTTTVSDLKTISATILVDEDGLIHDFSGEALTSDRFTAEFDYDFSVESSPPNEPSWMDSRPRVTYRVNATEITLEHSHGGERIPAGTNVTVYLQNHSVLSQPTIRLPKSLGDGDVAHLTPNVTKDSASRQHQASGNATVNRPPLREPKTNYSGWNVKLYLKTNEWYLTLQSPEKSTAEQSDNSSESTTTYEA